MAADRDRPLSPHLQVYKLPLNALLSITHRLTGLVLALGSAGVVLMLVMAASGSRTYQAFHAASYHWLGQVILVAFTLALYYHLCAGIRHLFWDAGYGYDLKTANLGSWLILLGAVVLTALTWLVALTASGG
jgi:succinate dehydrogenase / fumarate reductase cytochrome b subunit